MRDLTVEELGHVYGAGGKGRRSDDGGRDRSRKSKKSRRSRSKKSRKSRDTRD
ncbi:hypothetical protein [Chenggangzhangella methanolivorans]|uniref:Uncharacterized protein n=1 Tax=Chenggangzhangella methanolivorans TaxID=1437009 RepID=A0A9E6R696_9HYPH|nr:hypothetical protein [Chenggangzhangella methanolivorans]QZN99020.1 hypothetical protein K6K41_19410 [Chenggangzhangella methanolivorans]